MVPCLKSRFEFICETYGEYSREHFEYLAADGERELCYLDDGHDGPCAFQSSSEVRIVQVSP